MNRKSIYASILALLVVFVSLPLRPAAAISTTSYTFDFEQSLKPWVPASSRDKCVDGKTLQLVLETGKGMIPGQNMFAQLSSACGSNTWMQASLASDANAFAVSFDAKVIEGCAGCIPLLYLGYKTPSYPAQFTTDFQTLGNTWTLHKFIVKLPINPGLEVPIGGNPIFALGVGRLDMNGNVQDLGSTQVVGFDNVKISPVKGVICLGCNPK